MKKTQLFFKLKKSIFLCMFSFLFFSLFACNIPQKIQFRPIQPGEIIATDKMEFTILQSFITMEADSKDLGINFNLPLENNSVYFVLLGQIKNKSGMSISLVDNINAHLIFDRKFKYDIYMEPNDKLKNIVPLSTEPFLFFVSVPIELLQSAENFEYQIGFQKEIANNKDEICLRGSTNLYDSPKNIVNFHIFTEKILQLAIDYSGLSLKEIDEANNRIVFSWGQTFRFPIQDLPKDDVMYNFYRNRYFEFTPELWMNFSNEFVSSVSQNSSTHYGSIVFDISQDHTEGVAHVEKLIISSEAGKCQSGEYTNYRSYATADGIDGQRFLFSSKKDFDAMATTIAGNNINIAFSIYDAAAPNSKYEHSILCESSLVNAIKTFLKFYSECPASSLGNAINNVSEDNSEEITFSQDNGNEKNQEFYYAKGEDLLARNNLVGAYKAYLNAGDYRDATGKSVDLAQKIPITAIDSKFFHVVGNRTEGTYIAIGKNDYGQCNLSNWKNLVSIVAGYTHTIGLRSDGTVLAIGNNDNGQCDVSAWDNIVSIAAGSEHTVGLRSDGTVVAVGNNKYGQCNVSGWKDIISIGVGDELTFGITSNGSVIMTGGCVNFSCSLPAWKDIISITGGPSHFAGLKSNGTVVAAGDNKYGECGVSSWSDIVSIAVGGHHTVGLKADGTVVAVGENEYGQCEVSNWQNIVSIAAGYYWTYGLQSDGTIIVVGRDTDIINQQKISEWNYLK